MKSWVQTLAIVGLSVALSQGINSYKNSNLLAAIEPSAKSNTLQDIVETKTLRCAYIPYPPYFDMDPNTGIKSGIMVDMMNSIGEKMGVSIAWTEETGWGSMMEGLKAGRYDAVCSSVWQNTARAMQADFSTPVGYSLVEAWVRSDDTKVSSLERANADDVTIATMDGEMTSMIASSQFPKAKTFSVSQNTPISDLMMNVVTGKADVVFVEPKIAEDFLQSNPGTLKKVPGNALVSSFPITIVLPKGEQDFKRVIDTAIAEIQNTREMDSILANYKSEGTLFEAPARPF